MAAATPRHEIALDRDIGNDPIYVWAAPRLEVVIFRDGATVRAFSSICPHMGAQLAVDAQGRRLHCPWHGLAFDLGTCRSQHARYGRVREWRVEVQGRRVLLFSDAGGDE
jgi:nitrite reductase/ring-hydroxylating ferredoxin subunit